MPRALRTIVSGQPLHITQRGIDRCSIFHEESSFRLFLLMLREESCRCQCTIHAYVLMTNHVHLLLTPSDPAGPSRMMQAVGRRYVRLYNEQRERTGSLWDGRFRSRRIMSEQHMLACMRYIELNPVRAGLCGRPERYPWSSFRHNADGQSDPIVTSHSLYRDLGTSAERRRLAYSALFEHAIDSHVVSAIRCSTGKRPAAEDGGREPRTSKPSARRSGAVLGQRPAALHRSGI